jgi:hypothetical protein
MEGKCGGAVEKNKKTLLDASFQSMKKRKRMKKMMNKLTRRKIN